VIGGYTPGNPFDALIVGCYDARKLRYVSKVRNGFNPPLRRELYQLLKPLETSRCPFVNLPETRRSRWGLKPNETSDGEMSVAQAAARGSDRVHGVDA